MAKKVRADGQHSDPRQREAEAKAKEVDVAEFLKKINEKGGKR